MITKIHGYSNIANAFTFSIDDGEQMTVWVTDSRSLAAIQGEQTVQSKPYPSRDAALAILDYIMLRVAKGAGYDYAWKWVKRSRGVMMHDAGIAQL